MRDDGKKMEMDEMGIEVAEDGTERLSSLHAPFKHTLGSGLGTSASSTRKEPPVSPACPDGYKLQTPSTTFDAASNLSWPQLLGLAIPHWRRAMMTPILTHRGMHGREVLVA